MITIEPAPPFQSSFDKVIKKLPELLLREDVANIINQVSEEYYYWDKVKYLKLPQNVNAEDIWVITKIRRRNTPFQVQFGKYKFVWNLPSSLQQNLHQFDLNIGGTLESRSLIKPEDKHRYLVSSLMEEAIASSQIEGAVTTRKQAKDLLRKDKSPKNLSEQMIVNNYKTIQQIVDIKNEDLTVEKLLLIHQSISKNTLKAGEEGVFRASDDIKVVDAIEGEVVFHPPPYVEIKDLVDDLIDFFNSDDQEKFIHPIVKGIIIHFMIGYIHPFSDGNGRTARALFYWYLLKNGYWLTEYLSISRLILRSKTQYARAYLYTETDENDLTYFIKYNLRTMKLSYEALREYIQRKLSAKRQISTFLAIGGLNERQAQIIKWIYEEPDLFLTVKEVQTRLAISNQTARTDLQKLANSGYLKILSLNKKTEAFTKGDHFDQKITKRI